MRKDLTSRLFYNSGYSLITVVSIACLLPFIMVVSSSLTSENYIVKHGYTIFPAAFSLNAYIILAKMPYDILKAYAVTISLAVVGSSAGLFITAMTGYVLQRKDFRFRNYITFFIYFTTLFNGGLVSYYLLIAKHLQLIDSYFALLLPLLLSAWNVILMKNFMKSIPESITESAKLDGAGDFNIFIRIILPMSAPALAAIGLFLALGYWNDWYHGMLFIRKKRMYPLQLYLYNVLATSDFLRSSTQTSGQIIVNPPLESMKMATAVLVTGPIVLLYPLVQRFFIKVIAIGAVKG